MKWNQLPGPLSPQTVTTTHRFGTICTRAGNMTLHVRRTLLVVAALGIFGLIYTGSRYGLLNEGGEVEGNKCSMMHMYPSYWKIPMEHESRYSGKYELYFYQDEFVRRASVRTLKPFSCYVSTSTMSFLRVLTPCIDKDGPLGRVGAQPGLACRGSDCTIVGGIRTVEWILNVACSD